MYSPCTSARLKLLPWNPQFAKSVNDLSLQYPSPIQLKSIEKFIRFDSFICRDRESEIAAGQTLLTTWAKLLNLIQIWWNKNKSEISMSTINGNNNNTNNNSTVKSNNNTTSNTTTSSMNNSHINNINNLNYNNLNANLISPNQIPSHPPLRDKDMKLMLEFIDILMNRHEFDLIHLHPNTIQQQQQQQQNNHLNTPNNHQNSGGSHSPGPGGLKSSASAIRNAFSKSSSFSSPRFGHSSQSQINFLPKTPRQLGSSHFTHLSRMEFISLIQAYRKLLESTVLLVIKMMKESEYLDEELDKSDRTNKESQYRDMEINENRNKKLEKLIDLHKQQLNDDKEMNLLSVKNLSNKTDIAIVTDELNSPDIVSTIIHSSNNSSNSSMKSIKRIGANEDSSSSDSDNETDSDSEESMKRMNRKEKELSKLKYRAEIQAAVEESLLNESIKESMEKSINKSEQILASSNPSNSSSSTSSIPSSDNNSSVPPSSLFTGRLVPLIHIRPSLLTVSIFVAFTGRVFALAFFRLPLLTGALIDAMNPILPPSFTAGISAVPRTTESADTTDDSSTGPIRSPMTDVNGDEWKRYLMKEVDEWMKIVKKQPPVQRMNEEKEKLNLLNIPSNAAIPPAAAAGIANPSSASISTEKSDKINIEINSSPAQSLALTVSSPTPNSPAPIVSSPIPAASSPLPISASPQSAGSSAAEKVSGLLHSLFSPKEKKSANSTLSDRRPAPLANHRSLQAEFLSQNPSFFEWTRPELIKEPASITFQWTRGNGEENAEAINTNASSADVDSLLSPTNMACLRRLLSHSLVFFPFASAWLAHVSASANPVDLGTGILQNKFNPRGSLESGNQSKSRKSVNSNTAAFAVRRTPLEPVNDGILWDIVPGYWLLLQTILRRLILEPIEVDPPPLEEEAEDDSAANILLESSRLDPQFAAKKREIEKELGLRRIRSESITECRNLLLRNRQCREFCLSWFTELAIRHTPLFDKRAIERTLDNLDLWFNSYLQMDSHKKNNNNKLIQNNNNNNENNNGNSNNNNSSSSIIPPTANSIEFDSSLLSPTLRELLSPSQYSELPVNSALPWLLSSNPSIYSMQLRERHYYSLEYHMKFVSNPTFSTPFPHHFCHSMMNRALFILLFHQSHFQILLKSLTFLYMHLGHYYGKEREELINNLIFHPHWFTQFYFHWCKEIRRVFHFILLYRILRDGNSLSVIPGPLPRISSPKLSNQSMIIDGKEEFLQDFDLNRSSATNSISSNNESSSSNGDLTAGNNTSGASAASPVLSDLRPIPDSVSLTVSSSLSSSSNSSAASVIAGPIGLLSTLKRKESVDSAKSNAVAIGGNGAGLSTGSESVASTTSSLIGSANISTISATPSPEQAQIPVSSVSAAQNPPNAIKRGSWLSRVGGALLSVVEKEKAKRANLPIPQPSNAPGRSPSPTTDNQTAANSTAGASLSSTDAASFETMTTETLDLDFDVVPSRNRSNERTAACAPKSANPAAAAEPVEESFDDENPLKSGDPLPESCTISYTKLSKSEQLIDERMKLKLDNILTDLHKLYYQKTENNNKSATNLFESTSFSTSSSSPHSPYLIDFVPHLLGYAPASFREFRRYFASFRRVQSQISPSLQVTNRVQYSALLPTRRIELNDEKEQRIQFPQPMEAAVKQWEIKCQNSINTNNINSAAAPATVSAEEEITGIVIVPQLFYNIP